MSSDAKAVADQNPFACGSTAELHSRAMEVFPGGVLGRHIYPDDVDHVPVQGNGAWITDTEGRAYVDYSIGGGSLILGYSPPAIVEAVRAQALRAMQHVSIMNPVALAAAERLKLCVPGVDQVRFALSGAEANMFALRLARAATGRNSILKFDGAYHGNSDYALWNTRSDGALEPDSAGIPAAIADLVLVAPFNDLATTRALVEARWRDIAAIIVEPVQRFYPAEPGFLEGLRALADAHGMVLIFDEVVTGFRHALGGAREVFGVAPDLSVFGKALGGGVPISAVAGTSAIMAYANPRRGGVKDGYCYVTSSQAGNPLAAAAAYATIGELQRPQVMAQFHGHAETLKRELRAIVRVLRLPAQVVGFGPLWDVVFTEQPIRDRKSASSADPVRNLRFHRALIRNGVMVRVGGRSYFSTAHGPAEIEHTLRACRTALAECAN